MKMTESLSIDPLPLLMNQTSKTKLLLTKKKKEREREIERLICSLWGKNSCWKIALVNSITREILIIKVKL